MKMLRVGFICLVILMASVKSKKMRLNVIESRLTTLEMRMNIESEEIKSTVESVEALNNSISEIEEKVCRRQDLNRNSDMYQHKQDTKFANENRVIKAFTEQKEWLHSTLFKTENRARQYETNRLSFEENVTKGIAERMENIEARENQQEEKLERFQEGIAERMENIEARENQQEEKLKRFQETVDSLKTDLTSLTQKNKYLAAKLEEKDKVNEDILLEIDKLKETRKSLETVKICPSGWQNFSMYCYLFEDRAMAYPNAKRFCAGVGAHVVDIQSKAENDFVSQFSKRKCIWIGMTDEETEGRWKWDRTGEYASYTSWRPGQPNNYAGKQHCAVMAEKYVIPSELWDDVPCLPYTGRVVCKTIL